MTQTKARIEVPRTVDEAAEVLRDASARVERVSFTGAGTEWSYGYPAERVDLVVSSSALKRVVEYSPDDLVVQVEAGVTLATLQAVLGEHRQRLALDPSRPEATVGGLIATNAFGPRRARYGTLRDLVVGMTLIRADGVRVRGGGKVVKNVAGFDLPKIAIGSLGTLGMIATATFRLHPVPEVTRAARVSAADARSVRTLVQATLADQLEPAAFLAPLAGDGRYECYVVFEGFERGVAEQLARLEAIASQAGWSSSEIAASDAFAHDAGVRNRGDLQLRCAVPPRAFEAMHRDALEPFFGTFPGAAVVGYPTLGIAFASAPLPGDGQDVSSAQVIALQAMRAALESIGGHLVVQAAPPDLAPRFDPFGTLPPSFPLMRRLKDRFDPEHRLNPGRFLGKL